MSCRCETHGGREAVAVGNLNFVEKMKSEKKVAASRTDFLDLSADSVGIQKSKSIQQPQGSGYLNCLNGLNGAQRLSGLNACLFTNEALRPENTLPWEGITEVAAT